LAGRVGCGVKAKEGNLDVGRGRVGDQIGGGEMSVGQWMEGSGIDRKPLASTLEARRLIDTLAVKSFRLLRLAPKGKS